MTRSCPDTPARPRSSPGRRRPPAGIVVPRPAVCRPLLLLALALGAAGVGCRLPSRTLPAESTGGMSGSAERGQSEKPVGVPALVSFDAQTPSRAYGPEDASLACCAGPKVCPPPESFTFLNDLDGFLPLLREDAGGLVNWHNAVLVGAALAGSLALRDDLDEEVRRETFQHPERWGTASNVLGRLGEVQYQVPVLLAVYGYSLREQDAALRDLSASLISAYTLTGLSTTLVKGVSDTDRPSEKWNNGHYGFPSFHAASSMSIAAVLDEYYGPQVGLPAITLAGLIGWSRIDERDHDLSDVVFGAALGYVIGKSVASRHRTGDSRVHVLPWTHPTQGTSGLQVDVQW